MSITDELRAWWVRKFPVMDKELHKDFTAIADRIDAEHESACAEAYGNGVMSVPIALDENAWVELPKDADEVPWNVGDRDEDGNVVTQLRVSSDGWYVITDGLSAYHPEQRRHHHAPTVEDVLREFANEVYADADNEIRDRDFLCAKYAKRLKLAEGEDA